MSSTLYGGKFSLFFSSVLILTSLVVAFTAPTALSAAPEEGFHGIWKNSFTFHVDDQDNPMDLNSVISLAYPLRKSPAILTSETRFTDTVNGEATDIFYRQSFGVESRFGLFDIDSEVVFNPRETRLEYWISETAITFGGFTLKDTFLVEHTKGVFPYLDYPNAFGAGTEILLSGDIVGGVSVEVTTLLGMEEDDFEQLGIEAGSGYDIDFEIEQSVEGGVHLPFPLSGLHYVSTTAEFSGQVFGCCKYDSTTKFNREEGFQYSRLNFTLESDNLPLILDTEIQFTTQTKSASIEPEFELFDTCFNIFTDFVQGKNQTYQFELEGFGMREGKYGNATFSSITSFTGNLWRDAGTDNIKLRAFDYFTDPDDPDYYQPTPYDQIISVETTGRNANFPYPIHAGVDFYFDMWDGANWLSEIGLVTVYAKTDVADDLDIGSGISITPEGGMDFLVEVDMYF